MNEYPFETKNDLLEQFAAQIAPMDFYRDVFPAGSFEEKGHPEQEKANGILCSVRNGKGRHSLVFDELDEIREHLDDDFVIISPVAYFGRRRTSQNASMMYGICFDLDDVGYQELLWILERLDNQHFPRATYIANSGTGLHLYYLFDEPIPLYKSIHNRLSVFKHELTDLIWNKYTSRIDPDEKQYQGIFQGFRMVGSKTKSGNNRIAVFKTGEKIDIDYLNNYVRPEFKIENLDYESSLSLEEAKTKYPDWYERRVINNEQKGRWKVKRDLYDWWIRKVNSDPKLSVGHRYFCIAVLASYAVKCGISEQELRKDAYSFKPLMNSLKADFSDDDIESALNFYQESFINLPRAEVEKISGLDVPANKRNGRTQAEHIRLMNFVRDEINQNTEWRNKEGRPEKKKIVQSWKKENPKGKKIDCSRETGLHINTVYKWWDSKPDPEENRQKQRLSAYQEKLIEMLNEKTIE